MTINGVDLTTFLAAMLSAGLLRAVPLVAAALGEAVAERAGLLNLGIEGMMLPGSFAGFYVAYQSEQAWLGVLAGTFTGVMLGLLFGFLTIRLRADQTLVGLGITIAGGGFTAFLYRDLLHGSNPSAHVDPLFIRIPLFRDIPIVGNALFSQPALVYFAFACVPLTAWFLKRTRLGLAIRAAGDNPFAIDANGVSVRSEFLGMLPYLGIVIALIVLAGRVAMPAALGTAYERGRR